MKAAVEQIEPDVIETPEEIQKQLEALQKKLVAAVEKEESDSVELVDMPIADIMLKFGHGNEIPKKGVTPAEVAILAAMHHKSAGGTPISQISLRGTEQIDPINLKRLLIQKYSLAKVESLFPGPNPVFPTKFLRAVKMGVMVDLSPERLMDFKVQPMMSGGAE